MGPTEEEGMETTKTAAPMAPAGLAVSGEIPGFVSDPARKAARAAAVPHETKSASAMNSPPSVFVPTTDAEMADIFTTSESPSLSPSPSPSQEQSQAPRGNGENGRRPSTSGGKGRAGEDTDAQGSTVQQCEGSPGRLPGMAPVSLPHSVQDSTPFENPDFMCGACDTAGAGRSTACCRWCNRIYHLQCAGYDSKLHQNPPPDWVCADCPDGARGAGDEEVHTFFRGKGAIVEGGRTWCSLCLLSKVPDMETETKRNRCRKCGMKVHGACLDQCPRSTDGSWDCHECQRRRDGVALDGPVWARLRKAAAAEVREGVKTARAARAAKAAAKAEAKAEAKAAESSYPRACRAPPKYTGATSTTTATATAATGKVVTGKSRRRRIQMIEESDDEEVSAEALSPEATKKENAGERKARLPARPFDQALGEGGGRKMAISFLPPPPPMPASVAGRVLLMDDDSGCAVNTHGGVDQGGVVMPQSNRAGIITPAVAAHDKVRSSPSGGKPSSSTDMVRSWKAAAATAAADATAAAAATAAPAAISDAMSRHSKPLSVVTGGCDDADSDIDVCGFGVTGVGGDGAGAAVAADAAGAGLAGAAAFYADAFGAAAAATAAAAGGATVAGGAAGAAGAAAAAGSTVTAPSVGVGATVAREETDAGAVSRVQRTKAAVKSSSSTMSGGGGKKKGSLTCQACKKAGKAITGKTCGRCRKWWHGTAFCAGANACPGSGEWVGTWKCLGCLVLWEQEIRDRAAKVVLAWREHEERRERSAATREVARAAAAAESLANRRHGFAVGTVALVSWA